MRLTLRTLIAWLDDTLSPAEVREIGKQVAESPFAKDLRDRIQRVTRQRRLTVPNGNGPEGADPNLVAAYLDNELEPDRVNDFEKKCLTSDVHLAEVASVHQILSLIGQKAKVPDEARTRMYQLIKGREAVSQKRRRDSEAPVRARVSEPIQPWVTPDPPTRPWYERYLPAVAAALLFVVLCVSSYMSLTPPEPAKTPSLASLEKALAKERDKNAPPAPAEGTTPKEMVSELSPVATEKSAKAPASKTDDEAKSDALASANVPEPEAAKKAATPEVDLPAGSIGMIEKTTGIVLRYNSDPDKREWEQIQPKSPLKSQDRILSLAPFRSTIDFTRSKIELVGETEVWLRSSPSSMAGRFNLIQGRVIVRGSDPPLPFEIQFAGTSVQVTPPPGVSVGLERLNRREPGSPKSQGAVLRIFAPSGEVTVAADGTKETLEGPGAISFEPPGRWTNRDSRPAPSWVVNPPPPIDTELGQQLSKLVRPGANIIVSLVEGTEDESPEIRSLAISALRAIGDLDYIIPLLESKDPVSRRAAIVVLRAYLAQTPESGQTLEKLLTQQFGPEIGGQVNKLLVGFTPREAKDASTYSRLVQQLESTDPSLLSVRELALDNLQTLTGREDQNYDPANPKVGLKAWQDLKKANLLRPAAAAAAPAEAAETPEPAPEPAKPAPKNDKGDDAKDTPKAKDRAAKSK